MLYHHHLIFPDDDVAVANLQALTDKTAVGLSVICAVHCLLFPVAVMLLPSVATLALDDEAFHRGILFAVLPASLIALTMGCRKHQRYRLYLTGAIGVTIIGMATYLGHGTLGESGEKLVTFAGAVIIAWSHVKNFTWCEQHDCRLRSRKDQGLCRAGGPV